MEQQRRADGIPLHPEVIGWFDAACDLAGMPHLERASANVEIGAPAST